MKSVNLDKYVGYLNWNTMQNGTLLLYNDLISGSDNPAKSYNWLLISSNVPVFNRAISAIIYLPATSVILVYDDDLGLYKKMPSACHTK